MNVEKIKNRKILISVVMPVYNAEKYLPMAIESILKQSFRDFEFIIIDDGSNDGSSDIIRKYEKEDARIRVFKQKNLGLVKTLNRGIKLSRAKYIARMDADDVSFSDRLKLQYDYLNLHSKVGLIGGQVNFINENGEVVNEILPRPIDDYDIKMISGYRTALAHTAVMYRKSLINKVGQYEADKFLAEDHDLWCRIAKVTELHNLPQIVASYRILQEGVSGNNGKKQNIITEEISKKWRGYYENMKDLYNPACIIWIILRYKKYQKKIPGYTLKPFYDELISLLIKDVKQMNISLFYEKTKIFLLRLNRKMLKLLG